MPRKWTNKIIFKNGSANINLFYKALAWILFARLWCHRWSHANQLYVSVANCNLYTPKELFIISPYTFTTKFTKYKYIYSYIQYIFDQMKQNLYKKINNNNYVLLRHTMINWEKNNWQNTNAYVLVIDPSHMLSKIYNNKCLK